MKIAITGGTGFVGRSLVKWFANSGHEQRCLRRAESDASPLNEIPGIEWISGGLDRPDSLGELVAGCDAVVHSAYWRPGKGFRGTEGNVVEFARVNILGTLELIEASIKAGVKRFVFVSTCATHEKILDDRLLDESHPLWPLTHYGAHKAALEKFVHSYGFGHGFPICAIRPTGIYGANYPVQDSKWFEIIKEVVAGNDVKVEGGGKEVHVDDVARAVEILLNAPEDKITGESFACYDRYISQYEVAMIARRETASSSNVVGEPRSPRHEISTDKICSLGMKFGGEELTLKTVRELIAACE